MGDWRAVNWRQLELEQYGFPRRSPRASHETRYVLRQLIELVEQGCAPALAVRILSPVEAPEPEASR